ncbi:protein kinase family protein [Oerskovia sp. Sa1BUA8]|uniref:Protein kinase family protein n=1 Tax=Oerskovia douganii TaxID=2762210 RepID=A0A9D5YYS1_9CELL|nr:protein kinase family protein [Oerskovia douganii]MBE7700192.1 protein kinase family protein [Oerskovia douganii]
MTTAGPGTTLVGRYLLAERLASDLVDVTAWSAHDSVLNRTVRVSLVTGEHVAEAIDSARRAALVADPRLTRVLDVGTDDGVAYVITEPFAGITLSEVVAGGIVDAQQARAIVGEAAAALEVARRRGVHHLALRPEALRVDGDRVVVTGLGLDAGISGQDQHDAEKTSRTDTVGLVALLYYAMTARWAGPSLDVPWISPDSVHPLPAQRDASGIVPLATLVPGAPTDLSDLCAAVLADEEPRSSSATSGSSTTNDDTQEFDSLNAPPSSPADLVSALEPWGALSVVAALPTFVQPPPAPPAANRVSRQSIRNAFDVPLSTPPGTPPPAVPFHRPTTGRIHRVPLTGASALPDGASYPAPTYADPAPAYAAAPVVPTAPVTGSYPTHAAPTGQYPTAPPPLPVPPPPAQPTAAAAEGAPRTGPFATTSAKKRGVRTTWVVMPIVLLLVVVAVVWGVKIGLQGFDPVVTPNAGQGGTTSEGSGTSPDASGDDDGDEVVVNTEPLAIASGGLLDPDVTDPNDVGEKPEAVPRAIDGDDSTYWFTYSYKSADFGRQKSRTGYTVTLEEPATVQRIVLSTNNTGGHVEVRAVTDDGKAGDEVLASSDLSGTVELELDPTTEGTTFVLMFTELPPTSDGFFRVELNEVTVY